MQGCIAHSSERDMVLINVWQAYNRVTEAAVAVGFKSSILDLEALREEQASELLVVREALAQTQGDAVNLEKTLSMITGALPYLPSNHRATRISSSISGALCYALYLWRMGSVLLNIDHVLIMCHTSE